MQSFGKKSKVEAVCKNLWSTVFGDSKEYISWYFGRKWKENDVFFHQDDEGVVCSMLHCNPYKIKYGEKEMLLHYIVGVCTREDQRKKGYMGKLLQQSFEWLYEGEEPFAYLMPARKGIYEPYDFKKVYQAKKEWVGKECLLEKGSRYDFVEYTHATCQQKETLERISEDWLSSRFSIYAVRNRTYFQELSEQMQACNGHCLLIFEGAVLKGYLIYGIEEGSVEIFEILGALEREEIYDAFWRYLKMNEMNGFQVNVTPFSEGIIENSHSIMARIIHFPKCASLLSSPLPKEWKVKITDRYIWQNNGKWQLKMDSNGCQVTALSEAETVDIEMDIREFCEYFFRKQKIYINELV